MKTDLDQITQRTRQYWHVDGIVELAFGVITLLLGIYFFALSTLPEDSGLSQALNMGMLLFFVALTLAGKRLVSALKARLTYPRTGYVAYSAPRRKNHLLAAGIAMLMAAIVAALFVTSPASLNLLPAVSGLLIGAGVLVYASRLGILRFYLFALASFLIGVLLSFAGVGDMRGLAFYYLLVGVLALISGGLVLRNYLRTAPAPEEDSDGA